MVKYRIWSRNRILRTQNKIRFHLEPWHLIISWPTAKFDGTFLQSSNDLWKQLASKNNAPQSVEPSLIPMQLITQHCTCIILPNFFSISFYFSLNLVVYVFKLRGQQYKRCPILSMLICYGIYDQTMTGHPANCPIRSISWPDTRWTGLSDPLCHLIRWQWLTFFLRSLTPRLLKVQQILQN